MEISIKDISKIIKKNWVFVITVSFFLAFLSFAATMFLIPKNYTSTLKLYVETKYNTSTAAEDYQSINYAKNLVPTYMELLDSSTFYSAVSKNLGKKYTVSQLKSMIDFERIESTEVFRAIIVTSDPYEAKTIGDVVAQTAPEVIANVKENATLKIIDEATTPKNPTSPNLLKNVVLAFFGGFILAFVFATAREFLNTTIEYDDEMTDIFGCKILGTIPGKETIQQDRVRDIKEERIESRYEEEESFSE